MTTEQPQTTAEKLAADLRQMDSVGAISLDQWPNAREWLAELDAVYVWHGRSDNDPRRLCGNPKHVHSSLITSLECIYLDPRIVATPLARISAIAAQVERMLAKAAAGTPVAGHEQEVRAEAWRDPADFGGVVMPAAGEAERRLNEVWRAFGCASNPDAFKPEVRERMWQQVCDMARLAEARDGRVDRENRELRAARTARASGSSAPSERERIEANIAAARAEAIKQGIPLGSSAPVQGGES